MGISESFAHTRQSIWECYRSRELSVKISGYALPSIGLTSISDCQVRAWMSNMVSALITGTRLFYASGFRGLFASLAHLGDGYCHRQPLFVLTMAYAERRIVVFCDTFNYGQS